MSARRDPTQPVIMRATMPQPGGVVVCGPICYSTNPMLVHFVEDNLCKCCGKQWGTLPLGHTRTHNHSLVTCNRERFVAKEWA